MARRWARAVDGSLALAVCAAGVAEIWVPFASRTGDGDPRWSTLQVLLLAGALYWRRTQPLAAVSIAALAMAGFHTAGVAYLLFNGQLVPLLLLTFAVARYGRGLVPYLGGGIIAATMVYADLVIPEFGDLSELIFHWSALAVVYVLGSWQRVTAQRAEEAHHRAVAAETEAAVAVAEERAQIARELHDVVAHAMTLMVVTAGAAEGAPEVPAQVRRALGSIRQTGVEALSEMRRLVTMLRDPDEEASRMPQPGLAALERLVEEARDTGLPVSLEVAGDPRDLPVGLDLTAYRIIQEALTNARRHARAASEVAVRLHFVEEELLITVRDDGCADNSTAGSGHGLIGMRERVQLYGGRLVARATPGRGFAVEAALPLEPA